MRGIIPGKGSINIDIIYTASTTTTVVCEVEVKLFHSISA